MDRDRARLTARRDELRRVVYGAPGGGSGAASSAGESDAATELLVVEHELARLRAADEVNAASSAGTGTGTGTDLGAGLAEKTSATAGAAESTTSTRLRTRRRPALAAAGILAAGIAIGIGVTLAAEPVANLVTPPRGLEVFDRARDDVDTGPRAFVAVLGADAVSSFRSIGRAVDHDVWVFRDGDAVCMIAQTQHRSSWGANCVSETEFRRTGIRQYISYDELGEARPEGLDPASAVALSWTDRSDTVEWSIVPSARASTDGAWVWVPIADDEGPAPMTYEEWSSGFDARSGPQ
ncbi:hypothetical protein [Agromyces sp. CCNWLW203]|uniref:hypothetical protein n=1 Tax=Agromyces sp. CCNWLW203 TaxID=3112842 RepID=UPI002F96763D